MVVHLKIKTITELWLLIIVCGTGYEKKWAEILILASK
jgi:hypothetical protein